MLVIKLASNVPVTLGVGFNCGFTGQIRLVVVFFGNVPVTLGAGFSCAFTGQIRLMVALFGNKGSGMRRHPVVLSA